MDPDMSGHMNHAAGVEGKTVLVTGAAGGIGRSTARLLRERGATVLLTDVAAEGLPAALAETEAAPGRAAWRAADLTRSADIAGLFAWAEGEFGGVDHLVNNAGIVTQARLESFPDQDWDRVLAINLTAAYRCTKAYANTRIARSEGGAIVNVASMSYKGMTQQIAYSVSKGGLVTMTKSTAMELARHGVRANAVAPGMTETAMTAVEENGRDSLRQKMLAQIPLRRYAQPREMATVIAFLLSDDASYLTGEVLHVSGGARL
jgi:3-oxoacyl-[acyl-carrier protein] reductase